MDSPPAPYKKDSAWALGWVQGCEGPGVKVAAHHPLAELLAQLLCGIETVSAKKQKRMVKRACREAAKWHEKAVAEKLLTRAMSAGG